MNPIVLRFADGTAFFAGAAAVMLGLAALLFPRSPRWIGISIRLMILIGLLVALLSATPLSDGLYAVWLALVAASITLAELAKNSTWKLQASRSLGIVTVLFTAGLCGIESPYHQAPKISIAPNQAIVVIGDSLSAGIQKQERTWPAILAQLAKLQVTNQAQPGATVRSALGQIDPSANPAVVILEIGGNDLLGNADSGVFARELDTLIARLRAEKRTVVMFELPLPPFYQGFGRAQRTLARKHGVLLIPKRYLARVLGMPDGTIDGLHLSARGHQALAEATYGLLDFEQGNRPDARP